ncbi:MAG: hypothetical protein U0359_39540 [Byssovorax sp.]
MKAPSPLLGFNNNVRHKGRVFHIQTEDSGVRHPHIITHLFADGGRILKTTKTSYAEHIGTANMAETVRAMMQEQHKAMFIALRDGQFDQLFDDGRSPRPSSPKSVPESEASSPSSAKAAVPAPAPSQPRRSPPPPPPAPQPALATQPTQPTQPAQAAAAAPVSVRLGQARPRLDIDPAALHGLDVPPSPEVTVAAQQPGSPIDLDLDALERAAAEAQTPFFQQIHDLPPPPAAVLGKKPGAGSIGSYSVTPQPARQHGHHGAGSHSSAPPAPGHEPSPLSKPRATPMPAVTSAGARYAQPRPAAIFATTRPPEGASIFGEDLISEKSLDEVILSYLAEDLDGSAEKK